MKKTILMLAAVLCVLCAACGSDDEPQMSQGTMMSESHGRTLLPGTDIYLDTEHRLVTPSKQYSISLCTATDLNSIEAQQVNMSLNWRMKIAEGKVYAIAQVDRIRIFKSGKMALEVGAPITYIKVTGLITEGAELTGFHYETLSSTAERGNLPAWDTTYKFQKMDEDSWNATLPLAYGAYEIATYDNDYLLSTTNAERNYTNVEIDHRWVREDHSNDYDQRLLVTYTLDSYIYIRYGYVCTRAIVRQQ